MTLRIVDEPTDLDQRRRRGQADRGEGHWAAVWVDGKPAEQVATAKACRRCDRPNPGGILHQDPDSPRPERTVCGRCQGEANAERYGYAPGRAE